MSKPMIVLDDSATEREILSRIYRACGYETTGTDDVQKLIEQYVEGKGQYLLSIDIHLPKFYDKKLYTGVDLLGVLGSYDVPLCALVVSTDLGLIENARKAGARAFLEKGTVPEHWRMRDMYVADLAHILKWVANEARTRPVVGERVYGYNIDMDRTGFVKMLRRR